ncbi:MAG: hypothetical protein RL095_2370 [Verrucomicrobiota bacterium]|jgi:arylsulfatase A-like enzyme
MLTLSLVSALLLAAPASPAAPAAKPAAIPPLPAGKKPNIIFILADDQAWNGTAVPMDPQIPGSKSAVIQTPNLEKLAAAGLRFSQAYAPAPVCSPTRVSIQTGKTPASQHWTKAAPGVGDGPSFKLIEADCSKDLEAKEVTIGELLKTAGYATAHYGKWHISGGGPAKHGYDESDGDTGNRDADNLTPPDPLALFSTSKRAAEFIKKSRAAGKPFYVQISSYALHASHNALPETIAKYQKLMPDAKGQEVSRAAIMENLDTAIGQLLKSVDEQGLASSTYVIYMADNGMSGKKGVLSGGKGDLREAGIRVPFIIRGPGIPQNAVSRTLIAGEDLLPTFCSLAGLPADKLPKGLAGGDLRPVLAKPEAEVKRAQPGMSFHFPHYQGGTPSSALVIGDWKLLLDYEDDHVELYNLKNDPGEQNDLAKSEASRAAAMKADLLARLKADDAWMPRPNPAYDPAAPKEATKGSGKSKGEKKEGKKGGKGKDKPAE